MNKLFKTMILCIVMMFVILRLYFQGLWCRQSRNHVYTIIILTVGVIYPPKESHLIARATALSDKRELFVLSSTRLPIIGKIIGNSSVMVYGAQTDHLMQHQKSYKCDVGLLGI